MDTIWGCDPLELDELAEVMAERARQLVELLEVLRGLSGAVAWTGADAETHRDRTGAVAADGTALGTQLSRHAQELRGEAEQQQHASAADGSGPGGPGRGVGDPLPALRTELPWLFGPAGEVGVRAGRRAGREMGGIDWPSLPIGGPFQARDPLELFPPPRPLASDEQFALDPEILAEAEDSRRLVISQVPGARQVQKLMDGHEAKGERLERRAEELADSGPGPRSAWVAYQRFQHAGTAPLFGEKSALSQVAGAVDHQLANASQTTQEVTEALGEGDVAAAARAGERGLFRQAEGSIDLLWQNPAPAVLGAGADASEAAAGIVEPISPEAASTMRDTAQAYDDAGTGIEEGWEELTDLERAYDARRRFVPMPWDAST